MKSTDIKYIIENVITQEIKKAILENESQDLVYIIKHKHDGEETQPVECCQTEEEANQKLEVYKKDHPDKEFIIEKGPKPSFDELDKMGEELEEKENTNMENTEKQPMEGNKFTKELNAARKAGEKTFDVDGKEYDVEEAWSKQMDEKLHGNQYKIDADKDGKITGKDFKMLQANEEDCDECWAKDMDEEEDKEDGWGADSGLSDDSNESEFNEGMGELSVGGQINATEEGNVCNECGMTLNEEGMCNECGGGMSSMYESKKKRVLRLTETQMKAFIKNMVKETAIPGLASVEKHKKESGANSNKEIGDMMKDIEKSHQKIEGSDNPKFPNQTGKSKEKVARTNSKEEDEYVDDWRGGNPLQLKYDSEPSKQYQDRVEKSLSGHATTGNSQEYANVIKSDLGKKMAKAAKRKIEKVNDMPMYEKDPVVTTTAKKKEVHMAESVESSKAKLIQEEIQRMKNMANYDKNTQ
jgi:hypothetical protein